MPDSIDVQVDEPVLVVLPDVADPGPTTALVVVPCMYCRYDVSAEAFVYQSAAKRLLAAACPGCGRSITLAHATWKGWRVLRDNVPNPSAAR